MAWWYLCRRCRRLAASRIAGKFGDLQRQRKERHQSLAKRQRQRKERHQSLAERQRQRKERHQSLAERQRQRKG